MIGHKFRDPDVETHRKCGRCDERTVPTEEHLCADLTKRVARQEKAIAGITTILSRHFADYDEDEIAYAAEDVLRFVSGRDLGVD